MVKNGEDVFFISRCLKFIESKLNWGDSNLWTNHDFENLSESIFLSTGVRLSVTTLKRIWGRLKYDNVPTQTTLNALASYAGFENWRVFKQQEFKEEKGPREQEAPARTMDRPKKRLPLYGMLLLALPIPVIALMLLFPPEKNKPLHTPDAFEFTANKMISEGVPNSVVFRYDAKAAKTDSVFISQTWDLTRSVLVSKSSNEHSSVYYYPGFFRAKLIADGEIVRTHDIWITSNNWLCLAEGDPIPVYFEKRDFLKKDHIEVDRATLSKYNIDVHPKPPLLRFYNQRDMGNLMNDNFSFETAIKSEFKEGAGACQYVQVLIQCKDDIIIIPLGAKACIGDMFLLFCGKAFESKTADLSGFGCDLTQWTKLKVRTVNKHATIYVNEKEVFSLTFPNEPTGIVGVQLRFNGPGAVKETSFRADDNFYDFGPS